LTGTVPVNWKEEKMARKAQTPEGYTVEEIEGRVILRDKDVIVFCMPSGPDIDQERIQEVIKQVEGGKRRLQKLKG